VDQEGAKPLRLFMSYSHRDERLRAKLERALALLRWERLIEPWSDRDLVAGEEWRAGIEQNLEQAEIILLLVSADFIASDFIQRVELRQALERHEHKKALVIPVILRPCDWNTAPFARLEALPTKGKPIVMWRPEDAGFTQVAKGIRKRITQFRPSLGPVVAHYRRKHLAQIIAGVLAAGLGLGLLVWFGSCARVAPLLEMGEALLSRGRYESAKELFERASKWTWCSDSHLGLAKANLGTKFDDISFEVDEFSTLLNQLRKSHPEDADLWLLAGHLAYRTQKWPEAADDYKTALEKRPTLVEAFFGLGLLEVRRANWSAAEWYLEKAKAWAPEAAHYRENLGYVYFRLGKYALAKAEFTAALSEKLPLAALELSRVNWSIGELADARAKQKQAIDWLEDAELASLPRSRLPWLLEIDAANTVTLCERHEKLCYARLLFAATQALSGESSLIFNPANCGANGPDIQRAVAAHLDCAVQARPDLKSRALAFTHGRLPAARGEQCSR